MILWTFGLLMTNIERSLTGNDFKNIGFSEGKQSEFPYFG
jgi:hypothetical protein